MDVDQTWSAWTRGEPLSRSEVIGVAQRSFVHFINITQMGLYMLYFHSTGGATELLSYSSAVLCETVQEPWRSLSSLSTPC